MKILKMTSYALAAIGVLFTASAARAGEQITTVPFAFIVADTEMPAGEYLVTQAPGSPDVLKITNIKGGQFTYAFTIPAADQRAVEEPELLFQKVINQYFLAGVVSSDGNARQIVLTPSAIERELQAAEEQK